MTDPNTPTEAADTETASVIVLRYSHKHGDNLTVHFTEAEAYDELAGIAIQGWDELACVNGSSCGVDGCTGLPASPAALTDARTVRAYFDHTTEDFELFTREIGPAAVRTIARLAGRKTSRESEAISLEPNVTVEALTQRINLALRYLADNEDGSFTETVIEVLRGDRTE